MGGTIRFFRRSKTYFTTGINIGDLLMQCILREKLLELALKLSEVSNIYIKDNSRFVELYFSWLDEAEKELSRLRTPICIILQAEKSSLTSILDGYQPENIKAGKSVRKNLRAFAAQSLEKISTIIYTKIESIDIYLDQLNEKLCHAIAVVASKRPEVYDNLQVNQQGIDMIWKLLYEIPDTTPMYNYFCAKITLTDRNYLILDIIQKISNNKMETP